MKSETIVYTVPTWALSYLFNGDLSGYTDEEESAVVQFEKECNEYTKQQGASHCHFSTDEESQPYFAPCNDITGVTGGEVEQINLVLMFPGERGQ